MAIKVRTAVATLVTGGLLVLGTSAAAFAASPGPGTAALPIASSTACSTQWQAAKASPTVGNLQALGDCEVNRRLGTLTTLANRIAGAPVLTAGDRSALTTKIDATRSGLVALKATIDGDTTVTQLRADLRRIVTDYRVYLLVAPQVHLTIGADAESTAVAKLQTLAGKLANAISQAKANGKDVTAAQADLGAMNGQVAAAQARVSPIVAGLLPLTPAQWNAGTAEPVLRADRSAELAARALLATARANAAACVAALR